MLKQASQYLLIIVLLASCHAGRQDLSDDMPPLYAPPQKVALNTDGGYATNQLTGDSIEPIISRHGDTLKTGVPIPVTFQVLDRELVAKAKVFPASEPRRIRVHTNIHQIPGQLRVIPLHIDSLPTYPLDTNSKEFVLTNSTGDTVPTGIPLAIEGDVVPCIQSRPVRALPPGMKDNAIMNIRYFDEEQGLRSGVQKMLEDRHGNLWFGSSDFGLCMYTGDVYRYLGEREGLSGNNINSIVEDRKGNLWIATNGGGMTMYDGQSFTRYGDKQGLVASNVTSILEDRQGDLWFGTVNGGLIRYNGEAFIQYTTREGLSDNLILSLAEDRQGNLWIGTQYGGVCIFNGDKFIHITEEQGLGTNAVNAILEDTDGNLWFGTDGGGMVRFNGENLTFFTEEEGLSNNRIRSIFEDSRGNLWFGTRNGGVNRYDGAIFEHFSIPEGLSSNWIGDIKEDRSGNLWFCTLGGGVNIYKPNSFKYISGEDDFIKHRIRAISEDHLGNIWLGTASGEVFNYDGESWVEFIAMSDLGISNAVSIQEDSKGEFWLGAFEGGIIKYNGESFTLIGKKQGILNDTIRSIYYDSRENLWFGTNGRGIIKFDGEDFIRITGSTWTDDISIWNILEDSYNNLWFGTTTGAIKFDGNSFTYITEKEGLPHNLVFSLEEDSQGNLWFGTRDGAAVFDGTYFGYYTQDQGLSHNSIMSVLEDFKGNIWLSTDRGLNRIAFGTRDEKDKADDPKIFTYLFQDGLKEVNFFSKAGLKDSQDRLWWGNLGGGVMLDIRTFENEESIPSEVGISWIEINDRFIDFRQPINSFEKRVEFDSVARFYNYPLNLSLPFSLNTLSFHFEAIDWSAPHKLLYSYKLVGLEDYWNTPSPETKADYRNLPHGRYTFIVRAIGAGQKWSEPFMYSFTIRPPWWFSVWAYLIYGLIIVFIFLLYRRYLISQANLRTTIELERMEKEKVEELEQLKSRFFTNISHELRSPLTMIMGPINDLLEKQRREGNGDENLLSIMKRHVSRLQQLINQLLDLSKLESGKVKLRVGEGDLSLHVRNIVLSFAPMAESKDIDYRYEISELSHHLFFDGDKIEKILTNLLSNAFKFTHRGGKVKVGLTYLHADPNDGPTSVEITVMDNGAGIPAEIIDKIFDRFFQEDSSSNKRLKGTGIGLSLTKELVQLYRGEIQVESEVGKGSEFKVTFPVARDNFTDDEIDPDLSGIPEMTNTFIHTPAESMLVEPEQENEKLIKGRNDLPVILIVEDNEDVRTYILQHLLNEYQILEAGDGGIGMEKAIEHIPDLVITDLIMPEMDGMELCEKLKDDERTSHIPIIILTSKADRESKLEGLETGADDYILKPFDSTELKIKIRNLILSRRKLQEQFTRNYFLDGKMMELRSADERFLGKAQEIIERHISEPDFNTESFSRHLGISRMQLYRKLQGLANQSPGEFIRNLRLQQSLILLSKGVDNIAQIAYQVGFSDSSYYAKCFRKLYGMSPSDYANGQKKSHSKSPE